METNTKPNNSMHIGKKISRIRELRGMKQEALAIELGLSQQMVSKLEQSETVEEETLEKVAKALGVSIEGIKNFNEEAVFNFFNNFYDNSLSNSSGASFGTHSLNNCTFNPLDRVVELYERLLKTEQEKSELLKNK